MNDYAPTYNRRKAHYALSESRNRALVFLGVMAFTFAVGALIGASMGLWWASI